VKILTPLAIAGIVFCLFVASLLHAGEVEPGWPHLRGPLYSGVSSETGLIDGWGDDGPSLLWMVDLGTGYSGIIAVGDRLYTQAQDVYGQYVACLDRDTGKELWRKNYDWAYEGSGLYPGPRATPTYADGRIFFASTTGKIGCLDAESGKLIWSRNVTEQFEGKGTEFGYSCCPLVILGKVILPVGGLGASLVALHADDGSIVWKAGDEPASYCGAVPISLGDAQCIVGFLQNAIVLHDLETGKLLWKSRASHGYDEHAAYPMYREPHLAVSRPFRGGAEMFELALEGEGETQTVVANPIWFCEKMSNDVASSVLLDESIYGFDLRDIQSKLHRPSRGNFRCLDFATGEVIWSTDETGQVSLVAADEKLFMLSDNGTLIIAKASRQSYEELTRFEIFPEERCWTSPTLHDGRLYLRSPTRAACVLLRNETDLQPEEQKMALPAAEVVKPQALVSFRSLLGGEHTFPIDPPEQRELRLWFVYSLVAVYLPAFLVALVVDLVVRRIRGRKIGQGVGRVVFWAMAAALALVATPVGNRFARDFLFTWPAALCVVFQVTLIALVWTGKLPKENRTRRVSWLIALFFAAACLTYFHFCKRLGMAIEWVFLLGFIFASPVGIVAAYELIRQGGVHRDFLWSVATFATFFWGCAFYMAARMAP